MAEGIYVHINKPSSYRSIPDLVLAPKADLSFREQHRIRYVVTVVIFRDLVIHKHFEF